MSSVKAGPGTVSVTIFLQCHLAHNHTQKSIVNAELASLPLPVSVSEPFFMYLNTLVSLAYTWGANPLNPSGLGIAVVDSSMHITDVPV